MLQTSICFPEGKFKAVTLSYDDGLIYDRHLVAILNRYGLKGTFHLISGRFQPDYPGDDAITAEEIATLYPGHEVAGHTYNHPALENLPLDRVALEILADRQFLEKYTHYPVQGLSYPFGSYTKEIAQLLPSLGVHYSRVVGSSRNFNLPEKWCEWQPTCHHNDDLMKLATDFVGIKKSQHLCLMYVWGHSYEFHREKTWPLIEKFAELMSQQDNIWFCTNIEFQRYMVAARQVVIALDGSSAYNPSAQTVWLKFAERVVQLQPGLNKL